MFIYTFLESAHRTIHLLSMLLSLPCFNYMIYLGHFLTVFCSIILPILPHTSLDSVTLYDLVFSKATSLIDLV